MENGIQLRSLKQEDHLSTVKGSLIGKSHRPRTGSDDVNYFKNKTGVAHTFSLSRGRWSSEL